MKIGWKVAAGLSLWCAVGGILAGCGSGERIEELEAKVAALEAENTELQEKLDDAESAADDVRRAYGNLSSSIDQFSDGYSNWRDVVSEVQAESSLVESAIFSLEMKF